VAIQYPCGCEPETGADETEGIRHSESRRPYLLDQWQAHGPEYFVGEEYDDEGGERKDKDAEEA
jgi:hypothetical protein